MGLTLSQGSSSLNETEPLQFNIQITYVFSITYTGHIHIKIKYVNIIASYLNRIEQKEQLMVSVVIFFGLL